MADMDGRKDAAVKIQVNEQPIEVNGLTPEVTLGGLLEALSAELQGKGLTIVKITADGKVIDPEDAAALQAHRVLDCHTIDLLAATPAELVQVMVADSAEVLTQLGDLAGRTAEALRLGQVKEAMSLFLDLVDRLDWLAALLSHLPAGFAEAMHESGQELRRQQILGKTQEYLGTLRRSQETQDWVGLADVLEYECPDLLRDCQELFASLKTA